MKQKKGKLQCSLVYMLTIKCSCDSPVLLSRLQLSIEEIVNQFPDYIQGLAASSETVVVTLDKKKTKEVK